MSHSYKSSRENNPSCWCCWGIFWVYFLCFGSLRPQPLSLGVFDKHHFGAKKKGSGIVLMHEKHIWVHERRRKTSFGRCKNSGGRTLKNNMGEEKAP